MHELILSWAIGTGSQCLGGTKPGPSWSDIESLMRRIRTSPGSVTLDIVHGPEIGPQSLQVAAENGHFLCTLGEDDGNSYQVRSFHDQHAPQEQIAILGNLWDAKTICNDFDVVNRVVREFFDTGNVSRQLLS